MEYLYIQDGYYDIADHHYQKVAYDIDGEEYRAEKVYGGTVLVLALSPYGDDDLPY
jgi:hypothetical protein